MVLVGGGNVGINLAKRLVNQGHEVLLMEKDSRTASRIAAQIGEENVMVGDGCEMLTQKDAGFGRADVVVAVTGEDEDNLVICQMAKMVWNVERVLARVNDPDHEEIFRKVGIDETVSATGIIFALLEQQISPDVVLPIGALARGNLEVVEVELGNRSPLVGHKVRDLTLPPNTNMIWVLRGDQGLAVNGDLNLEVGDMVVAVVPRDHADELRSAFVAMKA